MDNLILDAETLIATATVIEGYCTKQKKTLEEYYSRIMSLEHEWRDDETFGSIANTIIQLNASAIAVLDMISGQYPVYFREKARMIMDRPVMQATGGIHPTVEAPPRTASGVGYSKNESREVFVDSSVLPTGSTVASDTARITTAGKMDISPTTTPRNFLHTQQEWHQHGRYEVFNSPEETGRKLNSLQGVPPSRGGEGVEGFRGTCGIVSCVNILRLAGLKITEAEAVEYAQEQGYCTRNRTSDYNGGTCPQDRQEILRHYGINSTIECSTDPEKIAEYVTSGRGVIASVDAVSLWYGSSSAAPMRHAIVVTSVERDIYTNEITHFYICDSGSGNSARKISSRMLTNALKNIGGMLNVTETIIR